ncbi:CHASE3 domain-containing protein [[Phormidium] sp. ETS-05]|uniref:CHASE3 domain-containing protein n=1 Tax=[Phormidium] sp. ETS-05 TaxID=222819 RepID=UPI0018EED63F|nr:CHASE3 domain-containing protein [[Phormidium] sp. ETS-05]
MEKTARTKFFLLRADLSQDQSQLQILAEINDLSQQKMQELEETILLKKSGQEEVRRLVLSGKGKNIMDEIRVKIRLMLDGEEKNWRRKRQKLIRFTKLRKLPVGAVHF